MQFDINPTKTEAPQEMDSAAITRQENGRAQPST